MEQRKKTRILLVDDDKKSIPYLVEDLTETYGYQVTWLFSADEAIKALQETIFQTLILDIMMPIPKDWSDEEKMKAQEGISTGEVLLKKIRKIAPSLPVLIVTGKSAIGLNEDSNTKILIKPEFVSIIIANLKKLIKDEE